MSNGGNREGLLSMAVKDHVFWNPDRQALGAGNIDRKRKNKTITRHLQHTSA
jgi:hypothetical protein